MTVTGMAEFCIHEKHGGICEKVGTYCNLGACPDEDLEEYAPVKRRRWIYREFDDEYGWRQEYECSECAKYSYFDTDYCPNCGAKMDEEEKE